MREGSKAEMPWKGKEEKRAASSAGGSHDIVTNCYFSTFCRPFCRF